MNPTMIRRSASPVLPAAQAAALAALQTQERVTDYPYYSSVCFRAAAVDTAQAPAVGPHTYTFPIGQIRRAFAYARGDDGVIAGFTAALDGPMSIAETNLVKAHETISGQQVEISGIGVFLKPGSTDGLRFLEARLLDHIATSVSIQLSLNGDENTFPLGTLQQLPGAGGLVGTCNDDLSFIPITHSGEDLVHGIGDPLPFVSNGWATRGNYYRLPSGIIWQPKGADSMLNVIFRNERQFVLYTGGTPERAQSFSHLVGETLVGFPPQYVQVVLCVQLIAQVVGARTRTA